jgi:hypothetical protein
MSVTPEPGLLGPRYPCLNTRFGCIAKTPTHPYPATESRSPTKNSTVDSSTTQCRSQVPKDMRRVGAEAATILDNHFTNPSAPPHHLTDAFHNVDVPIHQNEHITTAAYRADTQHIQETGHWLAQHTTNRCTVIVGLAPLTTTVMNDEDIPLTQTIGLLSNTFGPLAARTFERRGGATALLRLGDKVDGWGRVYVIEALCRTGGPDARPWLLTQTSSITPAENCWHTTTVSNRPASR